MIKFFRLSKHNFVKQNQMSCGHLVEIVACERPVNNIKQL